MEAGFGKRAIRTNHGVINPIRGFPGRRVPKIVPLLYVLRHVLVLGVLVEGEAGFLGGFFVGVGEGRREIPLPTVENANLAFSKASNRVWPPDPNRAMMIATGPRCWFPVVWLSPPTSHDVFAVNKPVSLPRSRPFRVRRS